MTDRFLIKREPQIIKPILAMAFVAGTLFKGIVEMSLDT